MKNMLCAALEVITFEQNMQWCLITGLSQSETCVHDVSFVFGC